MNSHKRYVTNSQLFMRQKNWDKPNQFYDLWKKVQKQKAMLDQYRDNPIAGGW